MNGFLYIMVGIAGGVGAVSRFALGRFITQHTTEAFPWGTLSANLLGTLLMAILITLSGRVGWLTPTLRVALISGFCGSFTTFSAFSLESFALARSGAWWALWGYLSLTLLGGAAIILGTVWTIERQY